MSEKQKRLKQSDLMGYFGMELKLAESLMRDGIDNYVVKREKEFYEHMKELGVSFEITATIANAILANATRLGLSGERAHRFIDSVLSDPDLISALQSGKIDELAKWSKSACADEAC